MAETCEFCRHYERFTQHEDHGTCRADLPPWVGIEENDDVRLVHRDDGCSLWRALGDAS